MRTEVDQHEQALADLFSDPRTWGGSAVPIMPQADDIPELCGDVPEQADDSDASDGIAEGAEGAWDE